MKRRNDCRQFPSAWRLCLTAVLFVAAQAAHAITYCVQTDQELSDALTNPDYFNPLTIQIRQGTYNVSGSGPLPANTAIIGGFTQNCASRHIASGNTVLTASLGQGLDFFPDGNLTVEGLTFGLPYGLGLYATSQFYTGSQILISRSTFTGGSGLYVDFSPAYDDDVGGVRIVDSLFVGNTACAIYLAADRGSATFDMRDNTVVNNPNTTQGGVCRYVSPGAPSSGTLLAHNNIFYGNGGVDLSSNSPNLELVDNIIGTHDYPPPNFTPVGTLNVDPKLDANYRPITSPLSPAINSGETDNGYLPVTDLDGGPRIVGSKVDRGAYESGIDDYSLLLSVTNNNDSGAGSLREAILSANQNPGTNIINFALGSGCGPHIITLASPLPQIKSPMYINGYSQFGASENNFTFSQNGIYIGDNAVICIVLEGATNNIADGLLVPASAPANTQLLVHGLGFSGFTHGAVTLYGGSAHTVLGNRIGGAVGNMNLSPSGTGVIVGSGVSGSFIGGTDPGQRNIIGDATGDGIVVSGSSGSTPAAHDNQILNNQVGAGWFVVEAYYTNRGNGAKGIHVAGNGNTISGNVVAFNGNDGIDLDGSGASGNTVDHNQIGGQDDFTRALMGNGSMGVRIENAAHANTIRDNQISHNTGTGVRVVSGQGNSIRKNSIYTNGSYGIDLAAGGVTPNDDDGALQIVDYANRGQNFPLLTQTTGSSYGGAATGSLTTLPGSYTVDFYYGACDASGYGEGQTWLRSKAITVPQPTIGDQGTLRFSISLPPFIGIGGFITATATDSAGNTSEFSACSPYVDDVIFADGFQ
jgi:parallel beta-helix repeat protein